MAKGKSRELDVPREPNGRRSRRIPKDAPLEQRCAQIGVPVDVVRRRAERLGLTADRLVSQGGLRACLADTTAGSAIGRMMWRHHTDGKRTRRMMSDGKTPVISDEAFRGAEVFRDAWERRERVAAEVARFPRAAAVERREQGRDNAADDRVFAAEARYQAVRKSVLDRVGLRGLHALEMVMIDDHVIQGAILADPRNRALRDFVAAGQAAYDVMVAARNGRAA